MNDKQEVTADQYKAQVMKKNFAARVADYEDMIASLQTKVAMLEQQLEAHSAPDEPESVAEGVEVIDPPPPPQ